MSEALRDAAMRAQQRLELDWRSTTSRDEGWFDATVPYAAGTPAWPGDTAMTCGWTMRQERGDSVNVASFTSSPHLGTHADAPLHIADGARPSESLPVLPFNGLVHIVDLRDVRGEISTAVLRERLVVPDPLRVFLRTGASVAEGRFPAEWSWLSAAAAAECVTRGLRLLGTDAPSVDAREAKALETHHACFDNGAWILENLDLRDVAPGAYELRALPMRVHGLDAAPVRVLLRVVS